MNALNAECQYERPQRDAPFAGGGRFNARTAESRAWGVDWSEWEKVVRVVPIGS
jgi:hypothetical protein